MGCNKFCLNSIVDHIIYIRSSLRIKKTSRNLAAYIQCTFILCVVSVLCSERMGFELKGFVCLYLCGFIVNFTCVKGLTQLKREKKIVLVTVVTFSCYT